LNFLPSSRAILTTKDCLFPIDSRGSLAAFFEPFYALVASLHPRETLSQGNDIISLLQQAAFNSIIHT